MLSRCHWYKTHIANMTLQQPLQPQQFVNATGAGSCTSWACCCVMSISHLFAGTVCRALADEAERRNTIAGSTLTLVQALLGETKPAVTVEECCLLAKALTMHKGIQGVMTTCQEDFIQTLAQTWVST